MRMENLVYFSNLAKQQIHLIGIGGSGMYPLAQILAGKGLRLSGSDNNETDTVAAVREMGIEVFMGHSPDNLANADVIVRSAAIKDDNPEIMAARARGLPVIERAELLGYITGQYARAICVAGTHGKTTVSSMIACILLAAGIDISAVIGGKLKALGGGSGRTGTSDIMVCEACEYADTFLNLRPDISVILNIDRDHLEYFKTMENLRGSFTRFCELTSGTLVVNGDEPNTVAAVKDSVFAGNIVSFGWSESNDYYPVNVLNAQGQRFELFKRGERLTTITLNVPGEHNILNAVAACAVADTLGCSGENARALNEGLEGFTGAGRRFEILGCINGITVADDYTHHPAEITATLKAAKAIVGSDGAPRYKRVWAVHQPFTYSRTATMLDEFAESLSIADRVTLTEIMGGREVNEYGVCANDLCKRLEHCDWYATFSQAAAHIVENARTDDLIITLGCGDVNKLAKDIVKNLKNFWESPEKGE